MSKPNNYTELLAEIKARIQTAQTRAVLAVNSELIRLYWQIGEQLTARQAREGWGAGVIPRLARDLHNELPKLKGFSERNLKLMAQFFRAYPTLFADHAQIGQPAVAHLAEGSLQRSVTASGQPLVTQLPWTHNMLLMQTVKDERVQN